MIYRVQDEQDEWEVHKQLKREYGHADDSKEWAGTVKGHLAKWKLIKKQSAKAAGSGRQGGGPVKKQQYSWRLVAEVKGNELSLGTFWTDEEAAKHFKTALQQSTAGYTGWNTHSAGDRGRAPADPHAVERAVKHAVYTAAHRSTARFTQ